MIMAKLSFASTYMPGVELRPGEALAHAAGGRFGGAGVAQQLDGGRRVAALEQLDPADVPVVDLADRKDVRRNLVRGGLRRASSAGSDHSSLPCVTSHLLRRSSDRPPSHATGNGAGLPITARLAAPSWPWRPRSRVDYSRLPRLARTSVATRRSPQPCHLRATSSQYDADRPATQRSRSCRPRLCGPSAPAGTCARSPGWARDDHPERRHQVAAGQLRAPLRSPPPGPPAVPR